MLIANPIYDVVFRYMMEDNKIAKLLISSIIGEEIKRLDFRPQDFTTNLSAKKKPVSKKRTKKSVFPYLTVYRLDFSAKIKTSEGLKNVLIEIQKAKFPTDIMRFRAYLGNHYSDKDNTQRIEINKSKRRVGIPIISIYFLGHRLDTTKATVIGVNRTYKDLVTGKPIETKEAFIESLSHDSYIIQIPELPKKRRNELEILLSVFDQSNAIDSVHHILNVREEDFPLKYQPLIRRLQKAIQEPEVKKRMELEDGIIDEMEDMQRDIEEVKIKLEQEKQEKQKVEQEKQIAEEKVQRVELEKQIAEQEKQKVERENELLKKELEKMKKMKK